MTEPQATPVTLSVDAGLALVVVDNPPVNALSAPVRAGLLAAMTAAGHDPAVRAIVIACAGRTFIAGADISEFGKPPREPALAAVIAAIEACAKPVVAALHGTALGGGFELALACHARVALANARVGLPEIRLGIIPGGGGTQRLPRLIGPGPALDLILAGTPVDAAGALRLGAIDAVVDAGDPRGAAGELARALIGVDLPARLARHRDAIAGPALLARLRAGVDPATPQGPAALAAIEAVETGLRDGFDAGLAHERALFVALRDSPNARALREAFFAARRRDKPA